MSITTWSEWNHHNFSFFFLWFLFFFPCSVLKYVYLWLLAQDLPLARKSGPALSCVAPEGHIINYECSKCFLRYAGTKIIRVAIYNEEIPLLLTTFLTDSIHDQSPTMFFIRHNHSAHTYSSSNNNYINNINVQSFWQVSKRVFISWRSHS